MYGARNAATSVLPVRSAKVSQMMSSMMRNMAPMATHTDVRLVRRVREFDIGVVFNN